MDSSHAFAPTNEELLRLALDDEALPAIKQAHIMQCVICQQQLAEINRVHEGLVTHFYRRFCPDGLEISLYSANLLQPEERMRLANHLLDCPLCAAEVAETRRFIQSVPVEPEPAFSPFSSVRRVFGVLTRQQAQLVERDNVESKIPKTAWPRQYRAMGIDLSLHLSKASNGEHMLLGILTSSNSEENVDKFERTSVELYPGSSITESTQAPLQHTLVDDLGNIVFKSVPLGNYALIIHLPDQDVVIEHITIASN